MVRSTRSQKVERLNAAYTLLAQGVTASEAVLRVVAASGVSLPPGCARHGPAGRAGRSADPDHHQDSGHAGGDAAGTFQEQRRFDRGAPVALVHQFQNVVAVDGFERAQAKSSMMISSTAPGRCTTFRYSPVARACSKW